MRFVVTALLVGCSGGAAPAGPANTTAVAARLVIPKGQAMGWIGVAPVPSRDHGDWVPAGPATVYLPSKPEAIQKDMSVTAIDAKGGTTAVIATGVAKLPYGCDNELEATALESIHKVKLAAGAVWVLPPSAPVAWAPRAIAITAFQASETHRRYTAGPVAIELERTDDLHGVAKLAWNGRPVHSVPFERSEMAGTDKAPINLVEGGVGVLEPIAAWAIGGERGAVLLVFYQQSYEGLHLEVVRIEEDRGVAEAAMGFYMYQCAF
ncbi:MAG: hypothetical protein ABI867_22745 [Kofleriaceae bacterium]